MRQRSSVRPPSNATQCIRDTTRATVEVLGDSRRIAQPLLASSNVPAKRFQPSPNLGECRLRIGQKGSMRTHVSLTSNVLADFAKGDGLLLDHTGAHAWIGVLHGDHRLAGRR